MSQPTARVVLYLGIPRNGMCWVTLVAPDGKQGGASVWLPLCGLDGHEIATGDTVDIWLGPDGKPERAEVCGSLYWTSDHRQTVCPHCRSLLRP